MLVTMLSAVLGAGAWGVGVTDLLTEGGYTAPDSESTRASDAVSASFGARGGDLVIIYTPAGGSIDDAELGKQVRERLAALPRSSVTVSTSYWNQKSPQFVSSDKKSAIALVTLAGKDDAAKLESFRDLGDDAFAVTAATVQVSGAAPLADTSSTRSAEDLARAELISLPVTLILLVLIFGSLVAASLPVLIGGAAVLGSLGILRAITLVHDVNSFSLNVASLLGLGMAIDYGLFMVGRFREEQAAGRTPAEAVRRTVATAGRTVVFSATLLMIALAGLMLFPQDFLKSLAYGGMAAVFLAALLSLTLLPAMLALLGPRVDRLPVRLPFRSRGGDRWGGLARFVLRHPVVVALPILAGLLLLASPIRGVIFGEADERTLPANDRSRQAIETLQADYPQFSSDSVQIVLRGGGDPAAFEAATARVNGIDRLAPAERAGDVTLLTATLAADDPYSTSARDTVQALRDLPHPAGSTLLVGGVTARNIDSLDATADRLPLVAGLLVGATLLLMFLAFGSILLPIKAVLMSALSLSATFGVLVWIFQEGHGASWLNITPAPLEVGVVVLMAAVVFGLSTDYEVFLLSRMVEARIKGADTREAVALGLSGTGKVISAAAVLLIVVTGAFSLASVTTMRFIGIGMIIALVLDATVVRMLLVPAVMSMLGRAAWWAPGPLRRLQEKAGIAEYAGEEEEPDAAVGGSAVGGSAVGGSAVGGSAYRYASPFEAAGAQQPPAPQEVTFAHSPTAGGITAAAASVHGSSADAEPFSYWRSSTSAERGDAPPQRRPMNLGDHLRRRHRIDAERSGMAAPLGAGFPDGAPLPRRTPQPPPPQFPPSRSAPSNREPQHSGSQQSGSQPLGSQHPGPQHPGPQHPGPQHPGPQHPGPQPGGVRRPDVQRPSFLRPDILRPDMERPETQPRDTSPQNSRPVDGRIQDAQHPDPQPWDARHWDIQHPDPQPWDARHWDTRHPDPQPWDARHWDTRHWDTPHWDARHPDPQTWDARHGDTHQRVPQYADSAPDEQDRRPADLSHVPPQRLHDATSERPQG